MKKNKNDNLINIYKNIYDLKSIKMDFATDDMHFLPYYYDKIYLINNKEMITYYSSMSNNIISYVKDIELKYNVKILNCFPICFTKSGIILSCKITNGSDNLVSVDSKKYNEIIKVNNSFNNNYNYEYEKEYYITEKYYRRYNFYRKFIKKYWLTEKRRKKKEFLTLLKSILGNYNSIIDVSCGDNEDIFKLSIKASLVVGNDINISEIASLSMKYTNCIFTNHNIINLPFKERVFDVAYCKNTFHHLSNKDEILKAVKSMIKIAKKVIIIDIEDPKKTGGLSKFLNKYLYIKYLKDNGKDFLSFESFKRIINESASEYKIQYKKFNNILGNYMIAIIERR